jgi:threonyl-tRNA synthetase
MAVKPMNCPGHAQLFSSQRHSYRDLPVRYSEPGLLHRNEASGVAARPAARTPLRPGRRAHLLHRGAGPRRGQGLPGDGFATYQLFDFERQPRALDTPRTARRHRRHVGPRRDQAQSGARRGLGLDIRAQRGRRRLLRTEDRHAHDRLARALLAARDRAARLLDARSASNSPTPAPTTQEHTPGDDPPRHVRLLRALHRDPDRALRRRAAALADAGAGDRAARLRPLQRLRQEGARRAAGSRAARRDRRSQRVVGRKIREAELRKIPYMLVVGEREERSGRSPCASTAAATPAPRTVESSPSACTASYTRSHCSLANPQSAHA